MHHGFPFDNSLEISAGEISVDYDDPLQADSFLSLKCVMEIPMIGIYLFSSCDPFSNTTAQTRFG